MKGIFLSGSFLRLVPELGDFVRDHARHLGRHFGAHAAEQAGAFARRAAVPALGLAAVSAAVFGAFHFMPDAVRLPGDRVAYNLPLAPADDRGAGWSKFAVAANVDEQDVARALGALNDSRRVVAAFEEMGYKLETVRGGEAMVPRVYLRTLPTDLSDVDSTDLRKSVFIKAMLPLILRVNEETLELRDSLQGYAADLEAGRALAADDVAVIQTSAVLYDVKPGQTPAMLRELMRRVDAVPPSLALTQAALESGWGTSRFAQEGNALFGQKAFNDTVESLLTRHSKAEDAHRYRSYDSLLSAVRSYVHNLNSHPAYGEFRAQRAEARKKAADAPLDGDSLARTLLRYSERGLSYTADLRQMIKSNGMRQFDRAKLETDEATQVASNSSNGA